MWPFRLALALVVTMAVPVAGYLMADHISVQVNRELAAAGLPPFEEVCASELGGSTFLLRLYCVELSSLPLLKKLSLAAAGLGAAIPGSMILASMLVGRNRRLLAAIFPAVVQFALFMTVFSVLVQGAVLTLGSLVAQAFFLNKVRIYIVIGIGAGALLASWRLFDGILDFGAKLRSHVNGIRISQDKAPDLHAFVGTLAEKLGANAPDNIVVGLEPNFFVTNADVVTADSHRPLDGQTLYVSAPLARLLTMSEFAAVIGHELGHFRGEDTAYSLKFAPVYAGLATVLAGTRYEKGEKLHHGLAKLPARAMLSFMMDMFAANERAIGRQRELLADKAGAEAASPSALASALVKVGLYAELWDSVLDENVVRLNQGKATRNLSSLLECRARYDIDLENAKKMFAAVAKRSIPHPTDTHPPVGKRLKALGVDPASIALDALKVPEQSAIGLFGNAAMLEENLSAMEHKHMVELGLVPGGARGSGGANRPLALTYRMAVPLITGGQGIDPLVVRAAEASGAEFFAGFDTTDFRQACHSGEEDPPLEVLALELKELTDDEHRRAVVRWLERIAGAAGEPEMSSALFIDAAATELGVAAPA